MASRKKTKNDTVEFDDAEHAKLSGYAVQLAERCAKLLLALPMGRRRDVGDVDGPWQSCYEWDPDRPRIGPAHGLLHRLELADLVRHDLAGPILGYLEVQTPRTIHMCPDKPQMRKDYDDMQKAAVKFAAGIRRFGVRNIYCFGPRIYVPGGVNWDDYPNLEAMLTNLESAIMWMENNPSLGPSWRDLKKPSARKFVMGVILVVEWYTGKAIQQDTKGTPTAELQVVKEIVAAVDPAITESTITGAIKDTSKSGLGARMGAGAGLGH
jgi:hypothetical protein